LKDYSLSLLLIRQAHSAFFAVDKKEIISMRHIVVLLGLDNITQIVMSCPRLPTSGPSLVKFQKSPFGHLMACSVMAATIATHLAPIWDEDPEKFAICTMFHHLGETIMAYVAPSAFKIIWELRHTPNNMRRMSKRMTGWTPAALGLELSRRWNLPRLIRLATAYKRHQLGRIDDSERIALNVAFYINQMLFYAGLKKAMSAKRQREQWQDLKSLAKVEDKKLFSLFHKGIVEFKDKSPFLAEILWEQGVLSNLLI